MKILFIGDIVGEPGRRAVAEILPSLRTEDAIDFVVANGENAAGGRGITPAIAQELFGYGIDVLTLGDHVWDQKEILPFLENEPRLLRPANYPAGVPGRGVGIFGGAGQPRVAVINLQARTFMPPLENPFLIADAEVDRCRAATPIILLDFHGEATSEKLAMGWFLDGRASLVVGTHTHVQTADDTILPGGTAYLTDAGFTGPHAGVIGREAKPVVERFLRGLPQRFPIARDDVRLMGVRVEIDPNSGRAQSIQRVQAKLPGD